MTDAATVTPINDYPKISLEARAAFSELEREMAEIRRTFAGRFTTRQHYDSAIAALVKVYRLAPKVRHAMMPQPKKQKDQAND